MTGAGARLGDERLCEAADLLAALGRLLREVGAVMQAEAVVRRYISIHREEELVDQRALGPAPKKNVA